MAFVLPQFNLQVKIWRHGNAHTNPADVSTTGNLSPGRIVTGEAPSPAAAQVNASGMWLRLPIGTDIRDNKAPAGADTCEVPAGSGRFYTVAWVDDIAGGFGNEHRFAYLWGNLSWPVPFPNCQPPPPPPPIGAATLQSANGSSGLAANSWPFMVPTGTDTWLIIACQWWGAPGPPTVNGTALLFSSLNSYPAGTTAAYMGQIILAVTANPMGINFAWPLGQNAAVQFLAWTTTHATPAEDLFTLNNGPPGQPTLTPAGAGSQATELYIAGIGDANEAALPTGLPPFAFAGLVGPDASGPDLIYFRGATYRPTVSGIYTCAENYPGIVPPWCGTMVQYY